MQFKHIVLDQSDITAVEYSTDKLTLGSYFWRVASIIEKNQVIDQGPFSLAQGFSLLAPQAMNEVKDTGQNEMEFTWPAEPGQSFLVQIAEEPDFKKLYLSKELDQAKLSIARPEPGIYYIRVRKRLILIASLVTSPSHRNFEILLRWTTGSGDPLRINQVVWFNHKNPPLTNTI